MHKATINGQEFKIESKEGKETLNGESFTADIAILGKGKLHIIRNHKSYSAEIVEINKEEGVTLIIVTHSRELAKQMGRVLELEDGKWKVQ